MKAFRHSALATVALVIAGIAASNRGSAYCRTTNCPKCEKKPDGCPSGIPIAWPTSCLTFSMHYVASKKVNLPTATDMMEKAFAAWTDASCPDGGSVPSMKIDHHFGEVSCDLHEYNRTDGNANGILFYDDAWPYEDDVLGLTTVTFKTGTILDVDMEFNATQPISVEDPVPTSSFDLLSIATHEAGHFFGLAHSGDPMSTMQSQYKAGMDSFRSLASDDVEGICAVYPPDRVAPCDFTPSQGFSRLCGIFPSASAGHCSVAALGPARESRPDVGWFAFSTTTVAICVARRRARRA